jgi:hypothetical protein
LANPLRGREFHRLGHFFRLAGTLHGNHLLDRVSGYAVAVIGDPMIPNTAASTVMPGWPVQAQPKASPRVAGVVYQGSDRSIGQ